jgi:hypothetical protein
LFAKFQNKRAIIFHLQTGSEKGKNCIRIKPFLNGIIVLDYTVTIQK